MDVSVIIVNYNTLQLTLNCINSIFQQTKGITFEVIVIDNASTDHSTDILKKDDRIILIESEVNLGFGKANNLGYKSATGKYIFLLNSDTLLLNNALKLFFDKMESSSESIACMGTVLFTDCDCSNVGHSYAQFIGGFSLIYQLYLSRMFKKVGINIGKQWMDAGILESSDFFCVQHMIGAAMFIRKNVADHCGLFDPDFFMYYEETEMQLRFTRAGYSCYIYRKPCIVHLEGKSSTLEITKKNSWQLMQYTHSQILYVTKVYHSWIYILSYKIALCIVVISLLLVHPRFSWNTKKECVHQLFQFVCEKPSKHYK